MSVQVIQYSHKAGQAVVCRCFQKPFLEDATGEISYEVAHHRSGAASDTSHLQGHHQTHSYTLHLDSNIVWLFIYQFIFSEHLQVGHPRVLPSVPE